MHLSPSCLRWFLALLPPLLWSLRCKAELQLWSAAAPLTCSTAPAHCSTAALQRRGMLPQPAAKCSPVSRCRTQSLQMVFTADTDLTHNNVRFNILELLIKDINYKIISGRPFLDWMKGFQHPAALLGIIQLYKHCI